MRSTNTVIAGRYIVMLAIVSADLDTTKLAQKLVRCDGRWRTGKTRELT